MNETKAHYKITVALRVGTKVAAEGTGSEVICRHLL